jgi:hypothetical protein
MSRRRIANPPLLVEEYLRIERDSTEKHEYRHGEILAMAGGTFAQSDHCQQHRRTARPAVCWAAYAPGVLRAGAASTGSMNGEKGRASHLPSRRDLLRRRYPRLAKSV